MRPSCRPLALPFVAVLAIAATGCAAGNRLGREVRVSRDVDAAGTEYFVGTPVTPEAQRLPVALFLEGDGSLCQRFSEGRWERFVTRFAGDHVLVRPVTRVNRLCETPAFAAADFLHRVDETAELLAALETRYPGRPLYLIGHSAGAHVALLAAARRPAAVRGLVDLGGGVDELSRVLPAIVKAEAARGRLSSSVRDERLAEVGRLLAGVREEGPTDRPLWGRTYRFWSEMMFSGVSAGWRTTEIPALVIHGEDDLEAVPFELVRDARDELAAAGLAGPEFVFLPGVGHDLLDPEVFLLVDRWIAARERADAGRRAAGSPPAEEAPQAPVPALARDPRT